MEDRQVVAVERRAKYLLIRLSGDRTLLGHLGMSGSFVFVDDPKYEPRTHDHVLFSLSNGTTMVYNDPRRFGVLDVVATPQTEAHRLLSHLGPEPLSKHWKPDAFAAAFRSKNTSIKVALLTSGLWLASATSMPAKLCLCRTSPRREASSVIGATRQANDRNAGWLNEVGVVYNDQGRGSTLKDFQNVDSDRYFAHQFQVYGRG